MKGRFLVLEGPDGAGKSSMLDAVRRHLEALGRDAVFVQDPGGTRLGDKIRQILLDRRHADMDPTTELFLYLASRAQLVRETIRPALEAGRIVVADRFTPSTLVYQGVNRALPEEELALVVNRSAGGMLPDRVLLLDVPPAVGLARLGKNPDRMELKGLQFFQSVRERYLGYAEGAPPGLVRVIDASGLLLEVEKRVLEAVDAFLE